MTPLWDFILLAVLPLLLTFAVGSLGWWVTHWILGPILAFETTRRQAHEEMYFNRNLAKDYSAEDINRGADSLRRMAARIAAISATSSWLVQTYFRLRGWDLEAARSGLQGLANVSGTREGRTITFYETEIALGFPTSERHERIERLRQREDRRED